MKFLPDKLQWRCKTFKKKNVFQLDSTIHVHLDEKRLAGYWDACKALTEDCDSDSQTTPYDQINSLIRTHNYQVRTVRDTRSVSLESCPALGGFFHNQCLLWDWDIMGSNPGLVKPKTLINYTHGTLRPRSRCRPKSDFCPILILSGLIHT